MLAGVQKYLRRLADGGPEDDASEVYALLRDPLNAAIVHRDNGARLLQARKALLASRAFRAALEASCRSGSVATAVKALVGLKACGSASPDDERFLLDLSDKIEGDGYRRFHAWLAADLLRRGKS